MKCPTDGSVLVMSERSGVEIDYCPTCRGVWLDRGELDKILERAAREATPAPAAPAAPSYGTPQAAPQGYAPPAQDPYGQRYDPRYGQSGYDQGHRRKKKEHWLSELFD
ncbi:zf-TFIIB domain-containing protein [Microbacterium sp. NPDC057407]|uniref:TFIIB-type zinc ribbon-containing protein n=1 Tax=Microbacterium sp. NPDC057407 TaxID=3346120 RepID=UPI00366F35B4